MTRKEDFFISPAEKIPVEMMKMKKFFPCYEDDEIQMVEIPYENSRIAMNMILPSRKDGIRDIEKKLDFAKFAELRKKMRSKEVQLSLPKFKIEKEYSLGEHLQSMGMKDPFMASADFSGIDGKRDLLISKVIHKTFCEVNEKGTEAAAATAVVMRETMVMPPKKPFVFNADHPFFFSIVHLQTGTVLFTGRLARP